MRANIQASPCTTCLDITNYSQYIMSHMTISIFPPCTCNVWHLNGIVKISLKKVYKYITEKEKEKNSKYLML